MGLLYPSWLLLALTSLAGACGSDDGSTTGGGTGGATGGTTAAGGQGGQGGGQGGTGGVGGEEPNTCSETVLDCIPTVPGCETDITSDPAHCGGCDSSCDAIFNATATCVNQTCGFTCLSGTDDCNAQTADGCETNTNVSNLHCGGCDLPCTAGAHAEAECDSGVCEQTCLSGWDDCNNVSGDGCEQGLADLNHCRACNVVCPAENGTAQCYRGGCGVLLGQAPGGVNDLDVEGGHVYLAASAFGIFRLPTSGGALESIVLGSSAVGRFVAVAGSNVYYPVVVGSSVVIRTIPVTGGTATDVGTVSATGSPQVGGFAVGASKAFVTVDDELWSVAQTGGTPVSVALTDSPPAIANGSVHYVHSPSHTLRASPENGGAESVVSTDTFAVLNYDNLLTVTTDYAFVANSDLKRVPLTTGVSQSAGGFFSFPSDLAADAQHVYFVQAYNVGANFYQSLGRRPVLASTSTALTHDRQSLVAAMTLDGTHVYFATGTAIEKMPK